MHDDLASDISITLSPAQVHQVVRRAAGSASGAPDAAELLARLAPATMLARRASDPRLSRSLLRGLALLALLRDAGSERGIVELAAELGISASTAHRYALTLVELGLAERSPHTRKYRVAR